MPLTPFGGCQLAQRQRAALSGARLVRMVLGASEAWSKDGAALERKLGRRHAQLVRCGAHNVWPHGHYTEYLSSLSLRTPGE